MSTEAMKLALDALEQCITFIPPEHDGSDFEAECPDCWAFRDATNAITALRQAIAQPAISEVTTEYGWLVENGKQGDQLRYRTWRDGMSDWTADHNEATRYCRRIDAEKAHAEDTDAMAIVEHAWHGIKEQAK